MAVIIYVYQCMKATCRYIEQYSLPGTHKCPKCGSAMTLKEKK